VHKGKREANSIPTGLIIQRFWLPPIRFSIFTLQALNLDVCPFVSKPEAMCQLCLQKYGSMFVLAV
jgi:hypothetical protein